MTAAAWDAQADTMEHAMVAVWNDASSGDGVDACLALIEPYLALRPGDTVVDLGCGIGRLTIPLARKHPETNFIGMDISSRMVALAYARKSAFLVDNVGFVVSVDGVDIDSVGRPGTIDSVYSMLTFQHVNDDTMWRLIDSVAENLEPGGVFRFQYVEGDHHLGLDHRRSEVDVAGWLWASGFWDWKSEHGLMYPEWTWVTAVKP